MIYLTSPLKVEDTVNLPMILFSLLGESIELNAYEMLIFTSKQAVKSIELLNPSWKKIPCISIGASTSRQVKELGGHIAYEASHFDAETLSQEILENFKDKKMLYLRPKVVSFDIKIWLASHGLVISEQILYKTSCISYLKSEKPVKNAIIVFTSPSTIKCFLYNFVWDESYTAVVIGESTKIHLPQNVNYKVADVATIEACIVTAKEILTPNRL